MWWAQCAERQNYKSVTLPEDKYSMRQFVDNAANQLFYLYIDRNCANLLRNVINQLLCLQINIIFAALFRTSVINHFVYMQTRLRACKSRNYLPINPSTYLLTPWSRVLLEKLTSKICSSSRNSQHLWNPKVPHRTHKCPPPVPILSQLHPVPTTPSNFLKIHLITILPSTSWSPQWRLSLRLPNQHPVHTSILSHTRYM